MIVVTGACGFIGSAIIWELNRRGNIDIIAVDDRKMLLQSDNLKYLNTSEFVDKNDFLKKLENDKYYDSLDGIIHMGACSSTTETNEDYLRLNNVEYTKKLANWCLDNDKRFVYASSAATYGDGTLGFSDDHDKISKLKPLNLYGKSKYLFDLWALENNKLNQIAGLKYFNVFGPNEYHKGEMRSVVHKAFGQIQATGKVKLFKSYNPKYKDGWQLRDFIYIKDAVNMTLFIYDNPQINGIYNIGTGKARSFYDLVQSIFIAMSKEPKIDYIEMPESIRDKYQYFTQADINKVIKAGYKDRLFSLEDAVKDYVQKYLLSNNPHLDINEE